MNGLAIDAEVAGRDRLEGARVTPEAEKVLTCANERFLDYMRDRHHVNEESVLRDVSGFTPAGALIRAVAEWRISQRGTEAQS